MHTLPYLCQTISQDGSFVKCLVYVAYYQSLPGSRVVKQKFKLAQLMEESIMSQIVVLQLRDQELVNFIITGSAYAYEYGHLPNNAFLVSYPYSENCQSMAKCRLRFSTYQSSCASNLVYLAWPPAKPYRDSQLLQLEEGPFHNPSNSRPAAQGCCNR